ncbi:transcriptional regulator [Sporosarcina sp. FSL W7-1349]|uniref:transcriptional regulator n=1 Tax=Sporosarcina sp. FSL W7-1349 TaxID=2921561 RepID=UPI0030FC2861
MLERSVKYGEMLDMMYMDGKGNVSQRRIKVQRVGELTLWAYCYARESNRTFTIDNILALVPVTRKERMVI